MRQLLGATLLLSSTLAFANANPSIIAVPIESLAQIIKHNPDLDVLGSDYNAGVAHVRLEKQNLKAISGLSQYPQLDSAQFSTSSLSQYMDYERLNQALTALQQKYPELAQPLTMGQSTEGRAINGLLLSSGKGPANKPAVFFNGMHHAREVMSLEVVYDIAEYLLENYNSNSEVQHWLDEYQVLVVPQVNPDGNAIVHNKDNMWRKNAWKDNWNSVRGVDLNRNYPYSWGANGCNGSSGSIFSQTYRGPEAGSEPETKSLMALVAQYQPIFDISYHSYSELIIYPFGCSHQHNEAKALFHTIAEEMNAGITNDRGQQGAYRVGTAPELLYQADGSDLDWQWALHNVMGYTIEVNASGFQPSYSQRDKTVANQRGGWMALLRRMDHNILKLQLNDYEGVSYRIYQQNAGKTSELYDYGVAVSERQPRANGLIYQPLPKGDYQLELLRDGAVIANRAFSIDSGITLLADL